MPRYGIPAYGPYSLGATTIKAIHTHTHTHTPTRIIYGPYVGVICIYIYAYIHGPYACIYRPYAYIYGAYTLGATTNQAHILERTLYSDCIQEMDEGTDF